MISAPSKRARRHSSVRTRHGPAPARRRKLFRHNAAGTNFSARPAKIFIFTVPDKSSSDLCAALPNPRCVMRENFSPTSQQPAGTYRRSSRQDGVTARRGRAGNIVSVMRSAWQKTRRSGSPKRRAELLHWTNQCLKSAKKSLPLSSTIMNAGKFSTYILRTASMPSSGKSTTSTLLMLFLARMAAGPPIEPR